MSPPTRWPLVPFGNTVENCNSRRVPVKASDREKRAGKYPYYGASGPIDTIDDYLFDGDHLLIGEDGANLLARSSPIAFRVGGKFWVNNHAHVVRFNGCADLRYLEHYFATLDLAPYVTGSAQPKLNRENLDRIPIPLPPLPEQRRIADILDRADAVRRKRKEAIALTEELLRATFLDMFGDPVTNPKGWPVKSLGDVSTVGGGLTVTHTRSANPIELPYLRVANVFRDRIDLTEVKTIQVTSAERERSRLLLNDVLVVEGHGNPDELGRAAVWQGELEDCMHQNHLIRVRATPSVVVPRYLSAYLNSAGGRAQMLRLGKTTSGLNTISTNNVRSVQLLLPPLRLQEKFVSVSEQILALQQKFHLSAKTHDDLYSMLVHRAFRGELASPSREASEDNRATGENAASAPKQKAGKRRDETKAEGQLGLFGDSIAKKKR